MCYRCVRTFVSCSPVHTGIPHAGANHLDLLALLFLGCLVEKDTDCFSARQESNGLQDLVAKQKNNV